MLVTDVDTSRIVGNLLTYDLDKNSAGNIVEVKLEDVGSISVWELDYTAAKDTALKMGASFLYVITLFLLLGVGVLLV